MAILDIESEASGTYADGSSAVHVYGLVMKTSMSLGRAHGV
jgi:hypothetical protein